MVSHRAILLPFPNTGLPILYQQVSVGAARRGNGVPQFFSWVKVEPWQAFTGAKVHAQNLEQSQSSVDAIMYLPIS